VAAISLKVWSSAVDGFGGKIAAITGARDYFGEGVIELGDRGCRLLRLGLPEPRGALDVC
jgi:hypothetical protein